MPKRESVKIETIKGDGDNSKIFIMSLNISGLDTYNKAKAIKRFVDSDTKVLETVIEGYLREILRGYGIIPYDGSENSLNAALLKLEFKGYKIGIVDRYYELGGEKIISESANHMTIIEEDNHLSCAIEIIVDQIGKGD